MQKSFKIEKSIIEKSKIEKSKIGKLKNHLILPFFINALYTQVGNTGRTEGLTGRR